MALIKNLPKYALQKPNMLSCFEPKCVLIPIALQNVNQARSAATCWNGSLPRLWGLSSSHVPRGWLGRATESKLTMKYNVCQTRTYKNQNILKLSERGLWKDRFPESSLEFEKDLLASKQRVYAGFDPTADSLHIGNLLVIMALLHCREAGHTPVVLLGGFTSSLGDPSGRMDKRPHLSSETAAANLKRIQQSIKAIFENHSKLVWKYGDKEPLPDVIFVNNKTWMENMKFSKLLPVFQMLKMKNLLKSSFIKERIDKPGAAHLNLKEFLYQTCQAYDWLHLYDKYQCKIQIGGSDQLANIVVGHDLIRDARGDSSCTGLTTPLLLGRFGEKLGKSEGNSVWLSSDRTSCFDFYQHFLRLHDTEVENMLKLLTLIPLHDIAKIMEKHWEKPEALTAQKKLAEALTLLVHGERGLQVAQACTAVLYHKQATALLDLSPSELETLFSGSIVRLTLDPGTTVMQAAMLAGCFKSEGDCEQTILAGGFHINQHPVKEPHMALVPDAHILPTGYSLLRVGKKRFTLVSWNSFTAREVRS